MPVTCININTPEVKALAKEFGIPVSLAATRIQLWQEKNESEEFPTFEELSKLFPKEEVPLEDIEGQLKETGFFSKHNDLLFIKKNFYVEAIKTIAKFNKKAPGLIKVNRANNFGGGGREIFHVTINQQQQLFSTEPTSEQPDVELNNILLNFLNKNFGITSQEMENVMKVRGYDVYALADFTRKVIQWAKGYEAEIPEEAAHMIFELLDSSIKESILNLVKKTQRYADYRKANPILYTSEREYAKEIAGQMLSEQIKAQVVEANPLSNMIDRFINFIKNIFKKAEVSELDNQIKTKLSSVAKQVLAGETTGMNVANMEEGMLFSAESDLVEKQISSLEQRREMINKSVNASNRRVSQIQEKKISESIKQLENNKTYLTIFKVAYRDYDLAYNTVHKPDITPEQLYDIQQVIDRIIDLDSLVEIDSLPDKLAHNYERLRTRTTELKKLWEKREYEYLSSLAMEHGLNYDQSSFTSPMRDITYTKEEFISLDSSHLPALNLAASVFEDIKRETRSQYILYKQESEGIRSKYGREEFKALLDANGRLITKTKSEYFDREKEMLEAFSNALDKAKTKEEKAILFDKKNNWYRQNNDYTLTAENEARYKEDLENIRKMYEEEDGSITAESEAEIKAWITKYNPYSGVSYAKGGKFSYGNYKWQEYLVASPKPKWTNSEYNSVKDTELYQFVIRTLNQGLSKVPHGMMLDSGNLDKVLHGIIFDINGASKLSVKSAISGIGDFWDDTFKVTLNMADIQGKEHGIVDEKGNLKPIIRSKSLDSIQEENAFKNPIDLLDKFYELALTYEHKVKAEPGIWLIENVLGKQKAVRTTKAGVVVQRKGREETMESGLIRAQEQLIYNIGAELYDKVRVDEKNVKLTEKEFEKYQKDIEEWEKARDLAIKNGTEIPAKPIMKKYSAVKVSDALVDFTRLNLLGLKPFSAITNLLVGLESNYLYAARGKDFTDSDLNWAFRKLMGNVVKYITFGKGVISPEVEKIANLAYKFGISSENLVEDRSRYAGRISAFLLGWQTSGEFVIANQILLAKMRKTKVTDLTGKERPLYDAYDKDGNWNTKEFGEQKEWTQEKFLDANKKNISKLKQFNDDLKRARKRTQGDYMDAMKFKSKAHGRVLMIFRTWLPRAVYERFGQQVGEDFKGRYLTSRDLWLNTKEREGFIKGTLSSLGRFLAVVTAKSANLPGIGYLGFKSLSELASEKYEKHLKELGLSDLDIENMRVNVREMQYIVYLIALGLALKGLAGDDDDPELTYTANVVQRLYQDMTFFYSFNSAFSIVKDPIPVYKTIQDVYEVVDRGTALIMSPSSDTYKSGFRKGKSKFLKETQDLVPVMSAYQSTMSTLEQVYGKSAYKYSK